MEIKFKIESIEIRDIQQINGINFKAKHKIQLKIEAQNLRMDNMKKILENHQLEIKESKMRSSCNAKEEAAKDAHLKDKI